MFAGFRVFPNFRPGLGVQVPPSVKAERRKFRSKRPEGIKMLLNTSKSSKVFRAATADPASEYGEGHFSE